MVEDHEGLAELLEEELKDSGLEVQRVHSAEEALPLLDRSRPDLVVSDLRLPGMDGISLLRAAKCKSDPPAFLIITAFGTVNQAVEALKAGADEFLTKPLDLTHFAHVTSRLLETRTLRREVAGLRESNVADGFHGMVGGSKGMQDLFRQTKRVAPAEGPVLILGESGSGKELVAAAVHRQSARKEKPFLAVNCAGIPESLMESEFFGHVEGAFTGAGEAREGMFQAADGGSLFLDEIAEMPLALQSKLLRVLQDGKVRRVGSNQEEEVNARVIAATHQNLEEAVQAGKFREDLFYRLETFTLRLPPLRERGEDIELLAHRFLLEFNRSMNKRVRGFSDAALERLNRHNWPGNVRELRNAIERAVTFCDGKKIQPGHLPARIRDLPSPTVLSRTNESDFRVTAGMPLAEVETRYIRHMLKQTGGNKKRAAEMLGITRKTLYNRVKD